MKRVIFSAVLFALAGVTAAQGRPSTLDLTCGQAAALVARSGAVVLSTGRHTYARFVSSARYCAAAEFAYLRRAPTRDGMCRVGYVCEPHPPLWREDDE
jgi:hypothetical protein